MEAVTQVSRSLHSLGSPSTHSLEALLGMPHGTDTHSKESDFSNAVLMLSEVLGVLDSSVALANTRVGDGRCVFLHHNALQTGLNHAAYSSHVGRGL